VALNGMSVIDIFRHEDLGISPGGRGNPPFFADHCSLPDPANDGEADMHQSEVGQR